jgi:hypothetical protein
MEVAGDQSAGKEETGNQSAGKEATGGQWTGKVQWAFDERMWRNLEGDEDLRVKVKLKDVQGGNVMDLEAFMERYDELKDYAVPTLHISAWVTKVFLQKCGGGVRSDVLSTDGLRRLRWNEDLLLQKPVFQVGEESSSCLGIFVAKAVGGHYGGPGRFVLLVSETESGDYERVGLGMLSANNIEGQKHDDSDDLVCENATPVDLWKDWKHLRLC